MTFKKHAHRTSDPKAKRETFVGDLDKLFDIGATDAVITIQNSRFLTDKKKEEDLAFYLDQKGDRLASMCRRDKIFMDKVQNKQTRTLQQQAYIASTASTSTISSDEEIFSDSSQQSSSSPSLISEPGPSARNKYVMLKVPCNIIACPEVTQACDRLKLSDNAATMLLSSVIKACNGNINEFSLSRCTTRRARMANRLLISQGILDEVLQNPPENVDLHWDGKLTADRFGNKHEAQAVIASDPQTYTNGKLLGIQKLENATGKAQAEASFEMLELWDLTDEVKAIVFDTTASNSGWKSGAAKLLENLLNRKVFYNACRHHIYELVVKVAWISIFGKATTGPENQLFNQFKSKWSNIDKHQTFKTLKFSSATLNKRAGDVVNDIKQLVEMERKTSQVFLRDDYKQCAEYTLALLNGIPQNDVSHHRPGATHSARWMS